MILISLSWHWILFLFQVLDRLNKYGVRVSSTRKYSLLDEIDSSIERGFLAHSQNLLEKKYFSNKFF